MEANIIVGSSDADQLDELINGANEVVTQLEPRRRVSIRTAASIEDIQRKRTPETILLVVTATLPSCRSCSAIEEQPALDYIRLLDTEPKPPACILVSDSMEHVRVAQRLKQCEVLIVDSSTEYVEYCVQLAKRLGVLGRPSAIPPDGTPTNAAPTPVAEPAAPLASADILQMHSAQTRRCCKYALIEVDLPATLQQAMVRLEIHDGDEVRKTSPQPLMLRKRQVDPLMEDCKSLKQKLSDWRAHPDRYYDRWRTEYHRLAERFGRLLWSTQSFTAFYNQGIGAADGNVRVRFNLEEPWFDGLWEALPAPPPAQSIPRFLMLDSTITRRALQRNRLDLFSSNTPTVDTQGGTLRVLAINSNVDDDSVPENRNDPMWRRYWGQTRTLSRLPHLNDEITALRELRNFNNPAGDGPRADVVVDVLPDMDRVPGEPWSLAEQTKAKLENSSQSYDIVHFAGHALFAEDTRGPGRGYLVFSGHPRPQAVSIATVASWLAKANVQLVYLSCCRSSAASAALEFARNNIPMAIGFHWDVDDKKAPVFASEFYQELLKSQLKVCRAVSGARLNLYNGSQGDDPIWASPVLIAQPMDWLQVETVLKLRAPIAGHAQAA